MLNIFFSSSVFQALLFVMIVTIIPQNVYAQQCEAPYEMVTKLHHPDPGSYTVWDTAHGKDRRDEIFVSVVNLGVDVLAVGEMRRTLEGVPSLMFVHFDHRGRQLRETYQKISGLRNVVKMLRHGDGYVVLANLHKLKGRDVIWLGFFDKALVLTSYKKIQDKEFDLFATDIVSSIDGQGWSVSVTAQSEIGEGKGREIRKSASVYLLDENGNERASRGYILGLDSEIVSLSVSKFDGEKHGYIATGYFENNVGKKIAWVLRLNADLSLVWQKEYSRGLSANIKVSSGYRDRYVLVFGDVLPADSNPLGSWLMLLDGDSGEVLWQRYYYGETGHHDYSAGGLYVNEDGLITLMMMARSKIHAVGMVGVTEEDISVFEDKFIPENMDYAHLLTLSPRGITLSGDSYYYGQGISLSQLIEGGDGGRVLVGYARVMEKRKVKKARSTPEVNPPLKEKGYVNLPDADLSDKAIEGLAMLRDKLKNQDVHLTMNDDHHDNGNKKESAINDMDGPVWTRDGWVLIGDTPDAYIDPCVRRFQ
ncbi:MAG: hypothetical protein COA45_01845 [Zetaproteobacteria bacterium]|nr:MAG: hypothetical protein COA45_01845 [Zetaproteobacteria bacterium]